MLELLDTAIDIWYRRYYHHKYSVSTCMILCNCVSNFTVHWNLYASKSLHEQMLHVVLAVSHDVHYLLQKHLCVPLYLHKLSLFDLQIRLPADIPRS